MRSSPIVTFVCLRCDSDCFEEWTEVWEVQVPCYWCPKCEATYPIGVGE